jgi:hypothetical protein
MITVSDWLDIADAYSDTLLLGNGASMAIDPCFSYRSLREAAYEKGLITPNIQKVFDYLQTQDFEFVMSMIWHAYHVNVALGVTDDATQQAYLDVKAALVGAVRDRHAGIATARDHLGPIAAFMKRFDTVLSLNYDLIVYWAMLHGNAEYGNWFKDCFNAGTFDRDWRRMREPYRADGATLVFYPHGNLALTTEIGGGEFKVVRGGRFEELLELVLSEWETGGRFPLFVSEGETRQKELAILRSPYLSTVYHDVIPSLGTSCVVYGWSASDSDTHMLKRVCRDRLRNIAFSIHRGSRTDVQIETECAEIRLRVRKANHLVKVEFFWADSPGCWLKADEVTT